MPGPPLINPPTKDLGPAMTALSENRRAFVVAWLELGGTHGKATEAAKIAGFCQGGSYDALRVAAYRLMHDERVLAAIREETDKRLRSSIALATARLIEIASDPLDKNSFKASIALLDRGGMQLATLNKHLHIVEDNRTDNEIERIIREMAAKQGLDPKKLLGNSAKVVDAEFSEVEPLGEFDVPAETNG